MHPLLLFIKIYFGFRFQVFHHDGFGEAEQKRMFSAQVHHGPETFIGAGVMTQFMISSVLDTPVQTWESQEA